jgi:hypothetical protein
MPVSRQIVDAQLDAIGDFHHFFTRREVSFLPEVLAASEIIHGMSSGLYEGKTWLIVITDLRLIFLDRGLLYGLKQTDLPLSQISSISHKTGLFFGEIQVSTSSGTTTIARVNKRDVIKICSIISGLIHSSSQPPSPGATSAAPPTGDGGLISQLEKLSALRAKGYLTEEEFRLAKAKLIQ